MLLFSKLSETDTASFKSFISQKLYLSFSYDFTFRKMTNNSGSSLPLSLLVIIPFIFLGIFWEDVFNIHSVISHLEPNQIASLDFKESLVNKYTGHHSINDRPNDNKTKELTSVIRLTNKSGSQFLVSNISSHNSQAATITLQNFTTLENQTSINHLEVDRVVGKSEVSSSQGESEKSSTTQNILPPDGWKDNDSAESMELFTRNGYRSCAEGCEQHGTCNLETGECTCPLGLTGPSCEQLVASACRMSPDYVFPCSLSQQPVPCKCLQECQQFAWNTSKGEIPNVCIGGEEEEGEGPDKLLFSISPKGVPEPVLRPASEREHAELGPLPLPPLDACPHSCNNHGWCRGPEHKCQCFYGYEGVACEHEAVHGYCPAGCQGRGNCTRGTCHCTPGFYGMDCSLVWDARQNRTCLFWEDHNHHQQQHHKQARPRIFVYDLPPQFCSWTVGWQGGLNGDFGRHIGYAFLDRLLSSKFRVSDPETADYFFVPALGHWILDRRYEAMLYIQRTWPYWNASVTPRHLWIGAHDAGAPGYFSAYKAPPREFSEKSIFLQHMGLHVGNHRCNKIGQPGGYAGAFVPGHDIVIPPERLSDFTRPPVHYYLRGPDAAAPALARNTTFLYIGSIYPQDRNLANNVRLQVQQHHASRPGFYISETILNFPAYIHLLATSKFCLAPSGKGGGWGMRFGTAVVTGCVPVIIMDNTTEVFEELLPYEKFSIRVAEADIPRLHEILAAVTPTQLEDMQAELNCTFKHFLWSSIYGNTGVEYNEKDGSMDAFSTVMEVLARRLDGITTPWNTSCGMKSLHHFQDTEYSISKHPLVEEPSIPIQRFIGPWPAGGAACTGRKSPPC